MCIHKSRDDCVYIVLCVLCVYVCCAVYCGLCVLCFVYCVLSVDSIVLKCVATLTTHHPWPGSVYMCDILV